MRVLPQPALSQSTVNNLHYPNLAGIRDWEDKFIAACGIPAPLLTNRALMQATEPMTVTLEDLLTYYRKERNFQVQEYLEKKTTALMDFFRRANINAVVVGISGGLDSAVVLMLLEHVRMQPDSPLVEILPISIPMRGVSGVTGQDAAANKARKVMRQAGYPYMEVELKMAYDALVECALMPGAQNQRAWVEGQMASVLRTPVLYYHAAILQSKNYRSLVVGTTNRDEGGYIGFFGKASDAMVDLQPIGDLHKSEVRELAKLLGVPQEIIQANPRGDVWDFKTDEEMIGASYWFLELYQRMLESPFPEPFTLSAQEQQQYDKYAAAIEDIHQRNAHKYQVGSPAHFVDVMPRAIPGGWK
jgi:NAD+ synthetase